MYFYSFALLLSLIGARFLHFQWWVLFSDVFTGIIIWVTVCSMNKIAATVCLVNAAFGLVYAIFETVKNIQQMTHSNNAISIILLIIIILLALSSYSLNVYASYYSFQVFGWAFEDNRENDGPQPGYDTIQKDTEIAKNTIS